MATAKKTIKQTKVEWKGYLRVNLTPEQEKHFDVWFPSQTIQLSDVGILANNGYKFSISWDSFHNGVSVSLYANDAKLSYAGWTLTAWASSVEEAIAMLFYKHYIVCEEDWEHFTDAVERMGRTRG
jgi:hypothetical protein